jgi:hypothetical protein
VKPKPLQKIVKAQGKESLSEKVTKTVEAEFERKLEKTIAKLKKLAPPNQRVATAMYLAAVYKAGRRMRLRGNKQAQDLLLKSLPGKRVRGKFNRFHILIERTVDPSTSGKQRGRYGRALQALHAKKVKSADFIVALKEAGGVNKLGDYGAVKSTPKSAKRVAGDLLGNDDW